MEKESLDVKWCKTNDKHILAQNKILCNSVCFPKYKLQTQIIKSKDNMPKSNSSSFIRL